MPQDRIEGKVESQAEKPKKVFNLFEMSDPEKEKLRTKISENGGKITVFMHVLSTVQPQDSAYMAENSHVIQEMSKVLNSESSPAIFLFEYINKMDDLKTMLGQDASLKNDICLVPTMRDFGYAVNPGEPDLPFLRREDGHLSDEGFAYVEKSKKGLAAILKDLGVTKMVVGGTKLEIVNGVIGRCVGNFMKY